MVSDNLINGLLSAETIKLLEKLYGKNPETIQKQINRYKSLLEQFADEFPDNHQLYLFNTPGRTEVGGNHTDHNGGRVLAAAIDLDLVAVVSPASDNLIIIHSDGYPAISVKIDELIPLEGEKLTSQALVRGVTARMNQLGFKIGGFRASIHASLPNGSGLSSSAAFEVLIATILNRLYNQDKIDNTTIAQIAQYSENNFFGKPCGLMDQTACAYGGLVYIDFKDFDKPVIEKVDFNFFEGGYTIFIVDTGGSHADMNDDYSALEAEMKSVARALGADVLGLLDKRMVLDGIKYLRTKVNDRAILRAIHFYNDDARVAEQVATLKLKDMSNFLRLIKESGESSWMFCQNCYSSMHFEEQSISIALAVSSQILEKSGAWRVHGGGFAGTIQVFVPNEQAEQYAIKMKEIFGHQSCHQIFIRSLGSICLNQYDESISN